MNKIFITGGAGYVGAVLVPRLLEKGYTVTVLDLMIYGEEVLHNHPNLQTIKGDIRNQKLLNELREVLNISEDQINFDYRKSNFPANSIIISAKFDYLYGNKQEIHSNIKNIKSIVNTINKKKAGVAFGESTNILYGSDYINEKIGKYTFKISPDSFFHF